MDVASDLSKPAFEFSSGDLSLDFSNSWSDRSRPESDLLGDYRALVAWISQAQLVPASQVGRLVALAAQRPQEAEAARAAACELREALFALFAGAASERPAEERARELAILDDWLARTLSDRELIADGVGFDWRWRPVAGALGELLAPLRAVVLAAAELLAGEQRPRIRECDAPNCSWLFLDRSRAGSRRWCSMESCGNRAKARRHYRRRAAAS